MSPTRLTDPFAQRLVRWPAWLISILLHALLFASLAWSFRASPKAAGLEPERQVGIVLVRQVEGRREFQGQEETVSDTESVSPHPALSVSDALPNQQEREVDLSSVLPKVDGAAGDSGIRGLTDATQLGQGPPRGKLGDDAIRTEVFGAYGEGNRFAYVFDRSGSMNGFGGRPLAAAKAELLASLEDLQSHHQFQIIFYNESPRVFNPHGGTPRLVWGDEISKRRARRFVAGIEASGGTEHMAALMLALQLGPDVLFFLTDADEPVLSSAQLRKIRRRNNGAVIHSIEFGFGPSVQSDNFLARLANSNGGQHVYVDVAKLALE